MKIAVELKSGKIKEAKDLLKKLKSVYIFYRKQRKMEPSCENAGIMSIPRKKDESRVGFLASFGPCLNLPT